MHSVSAAFPFKAEIFFKKTYLRVNFTKSLEPRLLKIKINKNFPDSFCFFPVVNSSITGRFPDRGVH